MSQTQDIPAAVRRLIVTHLAIDEDAAVDSARLCDDLGADSLDCVELAMDAEDHFSIEITDDEAGAISTVGEAIALVERKLAAATVG